MFLIAHERALPDAAALVDAATGRIWTYRKLGAAIEHLGATLHRASKGVVLILARNTVPSITMYLAALHAGHAVLPLDPDLHPEFLGRFIGAIEPEFVVIPAGQSIAAEVARAIGYEPQVSDEPSLVVWLRRPGRSGPVVPELSLLLATSGSTGNPKLVRLSRRNVLSNADAIRLALAIGPAERAITSLPSFYSYGLSVLHSHLFAGASVVVTAEPIVGRAFWDAFRTWECTSCAAVPYMFDIFDRLRFERLELPTLRTLTQAGGKLADPLVGRYHEVMSARGGRLMVMYGQTEATARITCLPAELLPVKLGSVGFPLRGGTIRIEAADGTEVPPGAVGEVVYSGPNVMLGYATERADLALGDEVHGLLRTGDLGRLDDDGCLFIVGRLKRFGKVFGVRVNLDDVEARLQGQGHVAVLDGVNSLIVCCVPETEAAVRERVRDLAEQMRLHLSGFMVRVVEAMPLLPNGKVDYQRLGALAAGGVPPAPRSTT